ncbi:hypothetical protein Vlu01_30400 [Micromonospora lutea]|uniref:Uncharacterized protein n=1 Tax=Micromonospora lutea TaxID=419825 RepID=A0ABQ4IX95_9ACTN|nr:hypothetical protein Vlu01_30400 [Micromonospora lutea]
MVLIGLALAADFRGIATRHVELSDRFVGSVGRFRRKGWTQDRLVRRRARFVALDRVIGGVTTLAGVGALVAVISDLLSRLANGS